MPYEIVSRKIGDTMYDVLDQAAFIDINGQWCPVLGYDRLDDILCAEDYTGNGYEIENASHKFTTNQIQIATTVSEINS